MFKSESIKELATALALAQGEMKNAPKSSDNPFYRSKYADLSSVWDTARGPLTKNGLSIIQLPGTTPEGKPTLETILAHSSGEYVAETVVMTPVRQIKGGGFELANDPQALGSAFSYARRYGLAAICGVATEDDDGNSASDVKDKSSAPTPQSPGVGSPKEGGTPVPPSPPVNQDDEISMRDYLLELCEQIAAIEGIEINAVIYDLTVDKKTGKYGKQKSSDIAWKLSKKDGTEWYPLKAIVSKAEKALADLKASREPGADDDGL